MINMKGNYDKVTLKISLVKSFFYKASWGFWILIITVLRWVLFVHLEELFFCC